MRCVHVIVYESMLEYRLFNLDQSLKIHVWECDRNRYNNNSINKITKRQAIKATKDNNNSVIRSNSISTAVLILKNEKKKKRNTDGHFGSEEGLTPPYRMVTHVYFFFFGCWYFFILLFLYVIQHIHTYPINIDRHTYESARYDAWRDYVCCFVWFEQL